VIDEGLEGMINYLPYFNEEGDNLNTGCFPEIVEQNLLIDYPRIKRTFTIPRDYDLSKEIEEKEMIAQLKKNLEKGSKKHHGFCTPCSELDSFLPWSRLCIRVLLNP
jgi:hypothetical protein